MLVHARLLSLPHPASAGTGPGVLVRRITEAEAAWLYLHTVLVCNTQMGLAVEGRPEIQTVIQVLREVFANKGQAAPAMSAETVLDRSLGLDSLDYAEVVVRLDSEFGADPFSSPNPPVIRTVADLAKAYVAV
jgi:acyl carrier protein